MNLRFAPDIVTRQHAVKKKKVVPLPIYLGRLASQVRVDEISPEVNVAILLGMGEPVCGPHHKTSANKKLAWAMLKMVIQADHEYLEKMVKTITVDGDIKLRIMVGWGGSTPSCFKCEGKDHIKAECPPSSAREPKENFTPLLLARFSTSEKEPGKEKEQEWTQVKRKWKTKNRSEGTHFNPDPMLSHLLPAVPNSPSLVPLDTDKCPKLPNF